MTVIPVSSSMCTDCVGRKSCFFSQCPEPLGSALRTRLRERTFKPGEVLKHQGETVDCLRVIKVGDLQCRRRWAGGEEQIVSLIGRGQLLGACAVKGQSAVVTVAAMTLVRVCELDAEVWQSAHPLDEAVQQHLSLHHRNFLETMVDWSMVARFKNVTTRVEGVLHLLARVQHSQLVSLPAHAVLAGLVGSSREAVVRALKSLENEGRILRRSRGIYEVCVPFSAYNENHKYQISGGGDIHHLCA